MKLAAAIAPTKYIERRSLKGMARPNNGYLIGIAIEMTAAVVGSLSSGLSTGSITTNSWHEWQRGSRTGGSSTYSELPDGRCINNGLFEASREGTPQGGPLSPLLSKLVLDELDCELERRGHCFVRYADDCNVYVRSEKAGHRVMASLTRFIEGRLKLQVNAQKSAVARPWQRSFLGFTVTDDPRPDDASPIRLWPDLGPSPRPDTASSRGQPGADDCRPEPAVAAGYFGFSQLHELSSLDGWTRRRLRCVVWVQWKTRDRRYQELRRLKVPERSASAAIFSPKGSWRLSSSARCTAPSPTNASRDMGCFPWKRWRVLNAPNRHGTGPYARWCGRGGIADAPLSRLTAASTARTSVRLASRIVTMLAKRSGNKTHPTDPMPAGLPPR